ncbi:MAG: DUF2877 domain-containing protein [Actinomycetota bacterium]
MRAFSAHAVAGPVYDLLDCEGIPGRVVGSWSSAAYIETEGFVVALTGRGVPFMPNGIALTERGGLEAFARGAPVRLSSTEIRSSDAIVRLTGAQVRDAAVSRNEGHLAADVNRRGDELLESFGLRSQDDLAVRARSLNLAVGQAEGALDHLGRALGDLDDDAAGSAAALLAGRGPGLTPEGDDVLASCAAGLLAFAEPCGLPGPVVEGIVKALTSDLDERTAPLSATLLRLAARGRVVEPATQVLDLDRRPAEWRGSLDRLMRVGHSTGRAYAWGCSVAATRLSALQLKE